MFWNKIDVRWLNKWHTLYWFWLHGFVSCPPTFMSKRSACMSSVINILDRGQHIFWNKIDEKRWLNKWHTLYLSWLHGFVSCPPTFMSKRSDLYMAESIIRSSLFQRWEQTSAVKKNRESTYWHQTEAEIYHSPSSFCFCFSSYSCQSYAYSRKHTTYIYSCNCWTISFVASSLSSKSATGFASSSWVLVDSQVGRRRQGGWGVCFLQWQHCLLGVGWGRDKEIRSQGHRLYTWHWG